MPGAMGRRTPARRARGARVVSAPKAIAGADMCLAFTLAIHAPCVRRHLHASPCLVCNTHHPDEALRWTSFVVGSRDAARSATSTSCTLPFGHGHPAVDVRAHITLDTRAVCVCACAPLVCAREIETLNVRALLDIDNIIERSVRAPSCDEHLRASTCLAANYLIGK